MKIRFRTSIAGTGFSYMEGQSRDLPDPLPEPFLSWLRQGIIEPVRNEPEAALAPASVEFAVSRRGGKGRRRRRASVAVVSDDDSP